MSGFQVNRPFCLKIGLAGVALVVLGVIFPWQGTQFLPGTFMENYPVTSWGLIAIAALIALLFLRGQPYHILGAAVVLVGWGLPFFSYFYFGRYTVSLWGDYHSPLLIPGASLFELGLMGIGGGALGLIYLEKQSRETARQNPPAPFPGEDTQKIQGVWQLDGIGQDTSVFPAGVITRLIHQTWAFGPDGQLTIKTLGMGKTLTYTLSGNEITTRDPLRDKSRRLEMVAHAGVEMVLRSLDPPGVQYRLVRLL